MINVFYDEKEEIWKISTKSALNADVYFYDDKETSFRDMFFEACNISNFNINNLKKGYSYIFILQHPNNRIVLPIITPHLYLIKIYKILDNIIENINIYNFCNENNILFNNEQPSYISLPNQYPIFSFSELINHFCCANSFTPGVMIYHISGIRTKYRNSVYEDIKYLRGNQPKLFFHYLTLYKDNRVEDYLYYYKEHKGKFMKFRKILINYTLNLWKNYINCFVKKLDSLKNYPFNYKIHMYNLHKIYLIENQTITKNIVINYIKNLDAAQILYALNYTNYN